MAVDDIDQRLQCGLTQRWVMPCLVWNRLVQLQYPDNGRFTGARQACKQFLRRYARQLNLLIGVIGVVVESLRRVAKNAAGGV
jgi:hypothetical protein